MGMNMAGEHCPNCGDDLEEGQIGLCEDCSGDRAETLVKAHVKAQISKATHGSPALDADARKLEGMGQDAGPTLDELFEADHSRIDDANRNIASLLNIIEANQQAWDGEEDSVKEEHAEIIELNRRMLEATAEWRSKQKGWEDASHVE